MGQRLLRNLLDGGATPLPRSLDFCKRNRFTAKPSLRAKHRGGLDWVGFATYFLQAQQDITVADGAKSVFVSIEELVQSAAHGCFKSVWVLSPVVSMPVSPILSMP